MFSVRGINVIVVETNKYGPTDLQEFQKFFDCINVEIAKRILSGHLLKH